MRTVTFLLFFLWSSALVFGQEAEFFLPQTEYKFAKIREGEQLKFAVPFQNTGDKPLLLTGVKAQCACTHFQFPLRPILPGVTDTIFVRFDSTAKNGLQKRAVTVTSTAPNSPQEFSFKLNVGKRK